MRKLESMVALEVTPSSMFRCHFPITPVPVVLAASSMAFNHHYSFSLYSLQQFLATFRRSNTILLSVFCAKMLYIIILSCA